MHFCSILNSLAFSIVSSYASKCYCFMTALFPGPVEGFIYASALISNCFSLIYSCAIALLGSVFTTYCHVLNLSGANLLLFALLISFFLVAFIFPWFFYSIFICVFVVFCIIRSLLNSARFYIALPAFHQLFCIYCTSIVFFPSFVLAHRKLPSVFAAFIQDVIFACPFKVTCAKLFTGFKVR